MIKFTDMKAAVEAVVVLNVSLKPFRDVAITYAVAAAFASFGFRILSVCVLLRLLAVLCNQAQYVARLAGQQTSRRQAAGQRKQQLALEVGEARKLKARPAADSLQHNPATNHV